MRMDRSTEIRINISSAAKTNKYLLFVYPNSSTTIITENPYQIRINKLSEQTANQ